MKAVVMAGGKGSRLGSLTERRPKALCPVNGRPLIDYVLENLSTAFKPEDIIIIAKYRKEMIVDYYAGRGYTFIDQVEMLGTGHALLVTEPVLRDYRGPVLTAFCDMPMIVSSTIEKILDRHQKEGAHATVLTADVVPPPAYGRILRDAHGAYEDVVEEKDCTPEQKKIPEVHVGMDVFDQDGMMYDRLRKVKPSECSGEIYLTRLPTVYAREGKKVSLCKIDDLEQIWGVNDPDDLARMEKTLRSRGR